MNKQKYRKENKTETKQKDWKLFKSKQNQRKLNQN